MDWNDRHNLEEQLSAYLDDELTDAERAEVEAVLAQDERARRTLEELRQTAGLLGSLPRGKAPADLIESLAAQMERSELLNGAPAPPISLPPAGGRLLRFLASAAVIVLAVSAGFMTFSYLGQEREPPRASSLGPLADAGDVPKDELRRGRSGEVAREAKTFDALVESDVVVEPAPAKPDATTGREALDALESRDGLAVGGEIALWANKAASAEIEPDVADTEIPAHAPAPLLETVAGDETARSTIANAPLDLHDKEAPPAAPAEVPAKVEFADALAKSALEEAAAAAPTEVGQIALTTDDAVARKIGTGVAAEAAEPSDADTVTVELVYADAATRDAAAVPIEAMVGQWQSMDAMVAGGRARGLTEMRWKASTPVGEANAGSSLAEPGDKVIVLDGSPEVIREAVRYVERVGTAAGSVRMKVDGAGLEDVRSDVSMPVRVGKGGLREGPSTLGVDVSQSHAQVALERPSSEALAEQPARPATQSVVVPEHQQLAVRRMAAKTASAPAAVEARSTMPPGQAVDHEAVAQVGQAASSRAFTFDDQAKEPRRMRLQIRLVAPSVVTATTQSATPAPVPPTTAPATTRPSVEIRPTSGPTAGL